MTRRGGSDGGGSSSSSCGDTGNAGGGGDGGGGDDNDDDDADGPRRCELTRNTSPSYSPTTTASRTPLDDVRKPIAGPCACRRAPRAPSGACYRPPSGQCPHCRHESLQQRPTQASSSKGPANACSSLRRPWRPVCPRGMASVASAQASRVRERAGVCEKRARGEPDVSLSAAHVCQHAARAMPRGPCRPPRQA